MLALLKLGFCRNGRRVWLRSQGFIKSERKRRHLRWWWTRRCLHWWAVSRGELAGSVWSRKTKGTRTRRSYFCSDQYSGWRSGLLHPSSTMCCHRFDSRAFSGVYRNFQTFQSVFLSLGVKGNVENYFRGIHLQIQSKWKKQNCSTIEN